MRAEAPDRAVDQAISQAARNPQITIDRLLRILAQRDKTIRELQDRPSETQNNHDHDR